MSVTKSKLAVKVERSIKLLRSIGNAEPIEVSFSGGKDSDVVLRLVQMSGIPYEAIYKSTTIDPPGTFAHVCKAGANVVRPDVSFFQLIERHLFPSRFVRFCCRELKEYKIKDLAVQGIRREESVKRSALYREPEMCRAYSKKDKVRLYLPILDWTLTDVEEFISAEGIRCHPLYYDADGVFHPERRVGCLCCPLAYYKHRINEFKRYPGMVRAYIRAGLKWWGAHDGTKIQQKFADVYSLFVASVFFHHMRDFDVVNSGLFAISDYKQWLEDFFRIDLP